MYIKIQEIKSTYQPNIKGILHIGAHLGEEAEDYHEAGYDNVIWIEGNPTLLDELTINVAPYPKNKVFNLLVSDKDNEAVTFNVTEFSQSSSILDLGITKEIHSTNIIERVPLTAHRLDSFFITNNLSIDQYNFVNVDLQGYELVALKSMGVLINKIDWVYTEVNVKALYKNCALLYQMDSFLLSKGFVRVQIYMTIHFWGDALYKRKQMGSLEKIVRLIGVYLEETIRVIKDFFKIGFSNAVNFAKQVTKKILFMQ